VVDKGAKRGGAVSFLGDKVSLREDKLSLRHRGERKCWQEQNVKKEAKVGIVNSSFIFQII
jgi:hypothetical protein